MPRHGKNFRKALEAYNPQERFSIEDAVSKSLGASFAKFDETVDVAIRLGVDPKYSDQMVRGAVTLPNGLGKTVRVAVFCKGEKQAEAKDAGADIVGAEDLVAKIKEGWLEFDAAVATPDVMALVGQIGRVLGPRGLMPNPKAGTVAPDLGKAVSEAKAGKIEYRLDKQNIIHVPVGKASFGAEKLYTNLDTVMEAIAKAKPAAAKGTYFKSATIATTMGPGIRLNTLKYGV